MVKKHILFIVENNPVQHDVRVWKEALAAKEFGYDVSVISPIHQKAPLKHEKIDGIQIYRHPMPIEAESKLSFLFEYGSAIFWEFFLAFRIYCKKPFHYIHSANPPDHIFIIAFFFKFLGVKYIFDHHDICPENYLAKFVRKDIFYFFILVMERLTIKTADIVISTNESYKKIAIKRGKKDPKSIFVVRNGPDLSKVMFMKPNDKWKKGFKYLVSYVVVIGNQEGLDDLLKTVKHIVYVKKVSNIKFLIIGTGSYWNKLVNLSKEMKIGDYVQFTGYIPYSDFYEILATSDVCVNPEHRNEFTDKSTMLKIMDYMSFGKPIVLFETTEGRVTAGDSAVYVKTNDNILFAEAITELLYDNNRKTKMGEIGKERINEILNWDIRKMNLKKAYEYLEKN